MERYRDAINTRRAASDLLSWSLGGQPRHGHDYDRPGYETPKNPAKPPRSTGEMVGELRGRSRYAALMGLRAVLIWWLSFDEKGARKRP